MFSIVLADDEQQILFGMKHGIPWEELGFTVVGTAQNGKEALEQIEEFHPDLLISDIKMPFMDGLELSKIIHENYMNTQIILFSGWDDFEYARMAISYGVSEYIMKPIDFDEMKKLLTKMHQELEKAYDEKVNRQRLENMYTVSLPLLRQQFFAQLVIGKMDESNLEQQCRNLKLDLGYTRFYIIAMKIKENNSEDVLSELSIKDSINQAFEQLALVYRFAMLDKEIYILCCEQEYGIDCVARMIEETAVMIQRVFHASISCGIGMGVENVKEFPEAYEQAIEALNYSLVTRDEYYCYYNDILPLQKKQNDWTQEVGEIEKIITRCTEDELRIEVDKLLETLHTANYNLNEYQIVILEILFSISRLYKKYQITTDKEFAGSKKMAVKILSLSSGSELDNWLINYCQLIRMLIQEKQIDNNIILAESAKKYVEEHFGDADLSVESICQELHVSSSYFSKIFKQETGVTFLSYLIDRRMEEAKRLLDKTDYKSHVIGEMVGYPEPNYFSYVFKKNCGISPAKYRKQKGNAD